MTEKLFNRLKKFRSS